MLGQAAPDFTLEGNDGKIYLLEKLRGQKVLLFFYVMNRTPG